MEHQPEHQPPLLNKDQHRRVELALAVAILALCAVIAYVLVG